MQPTLYTIVVEGELGHRYRAGFHHMQFETRNGTTAIIGPIQDQAELQGVLDTVTALGLSLVSVTPLHA